MRGQNSSTALTHHHTRSPPPARQQQQVVVDRPLGMVWLRGSGLGSVPVESVDDGGEQGLEQHHLVLHDAATG